ncbi:MAG TPA: response regulator [Thermoanaerobaculia bacterium]|nr:response regulator [Thermoanaerobaculia bacterium]
MTPHNPCVLVVDDEIAIRTLVCRVLNRAGLRAVQAADGVEAIDCLEQSAFDAIVLDLMMPRVDGFGVMDHLIKTKPDMLEKTIVLTAVQKEAVRQRVHRHCHVLSKPFDLQVLVAAVGECVQR